MDTRLDYKKFIDAAKNIYIAKTDWKSGNCWTSCHALTNQGIPEYVFYEKLMRPACFSSGDLWWRNGYTDADQDCRRFALLLAAEVAKSEGHCE